MSAVDDAMIAELGLKPVTVVVGHYGVGKTNFSLNLALDASRAGRAVTLIDLDVVNPYFRSSDYRARLEEAGVRVIAPVFAGTNVDGTSLPGSIAPAIDLAQRDETGNSLLIIDAGGDDAGATALGRFSACVAAAPYTMLYVVNRSRNLTQEAQPALAALREIEEKSHLSATAVVNNTHLQEETDIAVIEAGMAFALEVAQRADMPLLCTTVPDFLMADFTDRKSTLFQPSGGQQKIYPVGVYVSTPWNN